MNVKSRGFESHYEGALAEIAVCAFYGVAFDEASEFGTHRTPGVDLELDGVTAQVKSTPHFHPGVNLSFLEHDHMNARVAMLVCVRSHDGYCEIVGWARMSDLRRREVEEVKTRYERTVRVRRIPEGELSRPRLSPAEKTLNCLHLQTLFSKPTLLCYLSTTGSSGMWTGGCCSKKL